MSTSIKKTRGGIILATEARMKPTGKGTTIFPAPTNIPVGASSLLAISLEETSGTAKAIRVRSTPIHLPGGPTATWTLQHLAYLTGQTRPSPDAWDGTPVSADGFSILLSAAAGAVHVFRLRRVEAGITDYFSEASIQTPGSGVPFFPADGLLTPTLKPPIVAAWKDFAAERETIISPTLDPGSPSYLGVDGNLYEQHWEGITGFLVQGGLNPHSDWQSLSGTNAYTLAKLESTVLGTTSEPFYTRYYALVGLPVDQVFYRVWGLFLVEREALLDALRDAAAAAEA